MSLQQIIGTAAVIGLFSAVFLLGSNAGDSVLSETNSSPTPTQAPVPAMQHESTDISSSLKATLEEKLPGISIANIEQSPMEGIYQVMYSERLMYVSQDGQFIMTGNLIELTQPEPVNHTELAMQRFDAQKAPLRAASVAALSEDDMVVFKAADEKYVISVFTDVDCPYCRKFHQEVDDLNKNGVTVRYLAYPRAGIGSDAYKKLVSIWCADDRNAAMNDAKLKREFTEKSCKNPIGEQYALTRVLNLSGTPNIILADGELIGGYMPSARLIEHLQSKSAKDASVMQKNQAISAK